MLSTTVTLLLKLQRYIMILFLLVSFLVLLSLYFRFSHVGRLIHKIPGPKPWPLFGNTFEIFLKPDELFKYMRKIHKEHGNLNRIFAYNQRAINVYEPADIEVLLSQTKYNTKKIPYSFMEPWLGKGLLINNGEKWNNRRKLLTPAFHFNILKKFCRTFSEQSEEFVAQLHAETSREKTNLMPLVSKQTLHIMCETAMGTAMNENIITVTNKYFNSLFLIGHCIFYRVTRLWLYLDLLFNLTKVSQIQKIAITDGHKFTTQIIQERREFIKMNQIVNCSEDEVYGKKGRLAMLDLLLDQEKKGKINEEGIREEVDTFMFEGHDTTAAALCFMMMRIANETTVQELIFEELDRIFGDSDRSPNVEDLAEMRYLECCIKESMRLYPSVPFIARYVTEEVVLSGYRIPADTVHCIHIYDVHRRADLYPEPEKFIPERFLPKNSVKRHPYAYIPFSAGPRNCIGQKFAMLEMKTIMSGLLRKYRLEAVTRPEDIMFTCDLVLRSRDPLYVRFRKRNK